MPFKSKSQLDSCYAKKYQELSKGINYEWDCDEFLKETNFNCLPKRVNKKSPSKCKKKHNEIYKELLIGPKGGKYILIRANGKKIKKIYIPRATLLENLDYNKITYLKDKRRRKKQRKKQQKKKNDNQHPKRMGIRKSSIRCKGRLSPRKRRMMEEEIETGPRGGQFYYKNGKKIYLTSVPDY
jgi:hypothetical protein